MRPFSRRWQVCLPLFLALLTAITPLVCSGASPAGPRGALENGCYRGRVLTEIFRHRQEQLRRGRRQGGAALSLEPSRTVRADIGHIAIVDESNGVVIQPNQFDLNGRSLMFTRSGGGYTAAAGTVSFSETARVHGVPLQLGDDDATEVLLPFPFPFFEETHTAVFVNSDGNLTFGEADTSISARSFARAVSGPPRMAPFFTDLDPSQDGALITLYVTPEAFIVTWENVPEFSVIPSGQPGQTFQVALHPDGRVEFHYAAVTLNSTVVGVMPGGLQGETTAADFSEGVSQPALGALAEIFSSSRELDTTAVGQRFYQNHEDAYDFLVVFNDTGLSPGGGAFAFALPLRNRVLGIGDVLPRLEVFDFGGEFGSKRRLQTFINMGPLSNYPTDPTERIPAIGENNTLSVLAHEAGHRYLAYVRFLNPASMLSSLALLGRDQAHWSFFFNSDASVLEGNRIEDRGLMSPRFATVATVEGYSDLDQYLMGLRDPEETPPSFVVASPRNFSPSTRFPGSTPQTGVSFDGERTEVTLDMIIAAEGLRAPDATVSQKDFNLAFILLVAEGAEPSAATLAKLDNFRTQFEAFFGAATDGRAAAETGLLRMLQLSTWPAGGVVRGFQGRATVEIGAPLKTDLSVLLSVDNSAITVPSVVTIPAGATAASFSVAGDKAGVARLTAHVNTPGFDVAKTLVQVKETQTGLLLDVESGDEQISGLGGLLAEPIVVRAVDTNGLPYSGLPVRFTASRDGVVTPSRAVTDAQGLVQVQWRLASTGTTNTLTAMLESMETVRATARAFSAGPLPAFTSEGVVNAASFNTGASTTAIAPGSLVSIFGTGLAIGTQSAQSFPLPGSLGSTTVRINGIPSPLLYVSPGQINLQVPFGLTGTTARIAVTTPAGETEPVTLPLGTTQPGIFLDFATGLGAIVNVDDGTPVWVRPARAGTFVQVFCTGLGAVDPPGRTGFPAPISPLSRTVQPVQVRVSGRDAVVSFSGLAPTFAGLYQLNVELPADLPPGRHSLVVTAGGLSSNAVLIDVQ